MHQALDYVWELSSSGNGKRVSRQALCIGHNWQVKKTEPEGTKLHD